jgi:hypothetical protein
VEQTIQERLKREAKHYNKSYPGELVHLDTKRLPLLKGRSANEPREYLFVAIDDFSRELEPVSSPIKLSTASLAFSSLLLPNVLIKSTALIPITARNLKELTIMRSIKLAGSTVSVRSLLVSIVRKPTVKLSGLSAPQCTCGTARFTLKTASIDVFSFSVSLTSTIPLSLIRV